MPYNTIHEDIQECQRRPYHEEARPRIPRLEMPWERNQDKDECDKSKNRKGGVRRVSHIRRELDGKRAGNKLRDERTSFFISLPKLTSLKTMGGV